MLWHTFSFRAQENWNIYCIFLAQNWILCNVETSALVFLSQIFHSIIKLCSLTLHQIINLLIYHTLGCIFQNSTNSLLLIGWYIFPFGTPQPPLTKSTFLCCLERIFTVHGLWTVEKDWLFLPLRMKRSAEATEATRRMLLLLFSRLG